MKLFRIAAETRAFSADDLSGEGAARYPGRWNEEGLLVIYCAPIRSMAVLETSAHIGAESFPLNRFLVEINVPDTVWKKRESIALTDLNPNWAAIPAGRVSAELGSTWLRSHRSLILLVPSVIVPEESIALINPLHRDAIHMTATVKRRFDYNGMKRAEK